MNPKMTTQEAANCLGVTELWVQSQLSSYNLRYTKQQNHIYFGHSTARRLFGFSFTPMTAAFQIVKGGTGKTSIAQAFAIRANLYGARVLCVDLDQQANLTHSFQIDANHSPVMVDILAEGYSLREAILPVFEGLDILPSRIENALLDEILRMRSYPLETVYRDLFENLKGAYDLIVVDCPPSLGQSVTAITLAADCVMAPVTPETFAMAGLEITCKAVAELEANYKINIPLKILLNKFDPRTLLSQEAQQLLSAEGLYKGKRLSQNIRSSQEFPNATAKGMTIFDTVKPSTAKEDIDAMTRELLGLDQKNNLISKQGLFKPKTRLKATAKDS